MEAGRSDSAVELGTNQRFDFDLRASWAPISVSSGAAMCEMCADLDRRIEKFQRFIAEPFDVLTIERLKASVREMEAAKAELHPPVD